MTYLPAAKRQLELASSAQLPGFITNSYVVAASESVGVDEPLFGGVYEYRWPLLVDIKCSQGGLDSAGYREGEGRIGW